MLPYGSDFGLISPPATARGSVAARARALRLRRGLRQTDLAKAAGVAHSTLKRFETGADVGFDVVIRVMIALRATAPLDDMFVEPHERSIDEILAERRTERSRARRVRA